MRKLEAILPMVIVFGLAMVGCAQEASDTSSTSDGAASDPQETAATTTPGTDESAPPPEEDRPSATDTNYHSNYNANATYTRADIPVGGGYMEVSSDTYDALGPEVLNRVVHRVKTEFSTCDSGWTIDECLINNPQCGAAQANLKQIIREERAKS